MSAQTNPLSISDTEPLTVFVSDSILADRLEETGIYVGQVAGDFLLEDADGDENRLAAQALMFRDYIQNNAFQLLGSNIENVLHIGCGEGQLTAAFRAIYPYAQIVGIDANPTSIDRANKAQERAGLLVNPIDFAVCDIEQGLPTEQYDLVYVSMLINQASNPKKMLQIVRKAVKPGGYLWLKEPIFEFKVRLPSFMEFTDLLAQSIFRTGRDPYISQELPNLIADLGFYNITLGKEVYPLNKDSSTGRVCMGALLAQYRASIPLIAQVMRIPEGEIARLYQDICNNASYLRGFCPFANIIARRAGNFVG